VERQEREPADSSSDPTWVFSVHRRASPSPQRSSCRDLIPGLVCCSGSLICAKLCMLSVYLCLGTTAVQTQSPSFQRCVGLGAAVRSCCGGRLLLPCCCFSILINTLIIPLSIPPFPPPAGPLPASTGGAATSQPDSVRAQVCAQALHLQDDRHGGWTRRMGPGRGGWLPVEEDSKRVLCQSNLRARPTILLHSNPTHNTPAGCHHCGDDGDCDGLHRRGRVWLRRIPHHGVVQHPQHIPT